MDDIEQHASMPVIAWMPIVSAAFFHVNNVERPNVEHSVAAIVTTWSFPFLPKEKNPKSEIHIMNRNERKMLIKQSQLNSLNKVDSGEAFKTLHDPKFLCGCAYVFFFNFYFKIILLRLVNI